MVTFQDFNHRPMIKSLNHLVQHNKQHHRKVLLSSFHLNGHTKGFTVSEVERFAIGADWRVYTPLEQALRGTEVFKYSYGVSESLSTVFATQPTETSICHPCLQSALVCCLCPTKKRRANIDSSFREAQRIKPIKHKNNKSVLLI